MDGTEGCAISNDYGKKMLSFIFIFKQKDWYFVTKIVLTYCEKNLRSLEQSIQTVKGQNNFW